MLKALYDSFYTPPKLAKLRQEAENNHQLLIKRLEKPERKLILRIIDAKDSMAGQLSLDSQTGLETVRYKDERSTLTVAGLDALSISAKAEEL